MDKSPIIKPQITTEARTDKSAIKLNLWGPGISFLLVCVITVTWVGILHRSSPEAAVPSSSLPSPQAPAVAVPSQVVSQASEPPPNPQLDSETQRRHMKWDAIAAMLGVTLGILLTAFVIYGIGVWVAKHFDNWKAGWTKHSKKWKASRAVKRKAAQTEREKKQREKAQEEQHRQEEERRWQAKQRKQQEEEQCQLSEQKQQRHEAKATVPEGEPAPKPNPNKVQVYCILLEGKQQGPYTLHQIRSMWDAGLLTVATQYQANEGGGWKPLSDMLQEIEPALKKPQSLPKVYNTIKPERNDGVAFAAIAFVLTVVTVIIFAVNMQQGSPDGQAKNLQSKAYWAATKFIKENYPGAREFSSFSDSAVKNDGDNYSVAIKVDGLNAFGGPVRQVIGVQMEYTGDQWRLVDIKAD
jgi:hypothetical protein